MSQPLGGRGDAVGRMTLGRMTLYAGHDDHLHIRYCERIHPLSADDC